MVNLTQMPLDLCPPKCPVYKPKIENIEFHSDQGIYDVENTLSCEHEPACKMWYNSFYKSEK